MMRPLLTATFVMLVANAAAAPARGMTVDEVIEKHVEAKGGRTAWSAIESIKMTGDFTSFSLVNPYTLYRKRDNRYHLDTLLGDKPYVVAFDGETPWWDNHFLQEGAQQIRGEADLAVLKREVEFATPMFSYPDNGLAISLSDESDLEGEPAIALAVDRGDGSSEIWYLSPETYLEFARISPGSDFGRPMPQTTYFDDFREVAGAMIPHFSETQWYTRDRVFVADSVEVNVDVDDTLFRLPPPIGMAEFQPWVGAWSVEVESRSSPQEEFSASERTSTIEPLLGGAIMRERYLGNDGVETIRWYSYDRYRKHYVFTSSNDEATFLDIQQGGGFDDEGRLVVTNVDSGTTLDIFGMNILTQTAITDLTENGFKVEHSMSMDGGENWMPMEKLVYARADE